MKYIDDEDSSDSDCLIIEPAVSKPKILVVGEVLNQASVRFIFFLSANFAGLLTRDRAICSAQTDPSLTDLRKPCYARAPRRRGAQPRTAAAHHRKSLVRIGYLRKRVSRTRFLIWTTFTRFRNGTCICPRHVTSHVHRSHVAVASCRRQH